MEFGLILSLKEMTRRRVAVSLWNHDDIVTLIKTFAFSPYFHAEMFHKGNILYDRIIGKIEKLLLPITLEDELRETTYSVGLEILKFNFFQGEYLNEDNRFFFDNEIKIYWTVLGTIDKIRTAMSFVKDDKFDFTLRYKIACIYCLEDDIPILWEKMAQDKKISIKTDSLAIIYQVLIYFWESEMKKELFKLHELRRMNENVYVDALEYAACNGNIAATRYFFQKLSDEEKRKEGLRMTKKILRAVEFYKRYHSEVLQFLLLQMSEKDRLNVFQTCSYNLLCSFLEWPLQPYINDLAGLVWSYLDPSEFFELFRYIAVRNLLYKGRGCDYQSLFSGLWSGSSLHFKKYIILEKQWEQLLCLLYEAGDTGSASLILKMLAPEQVERFITGNPGLNLIHRLS